MGYTALGVGSACAVVAAILYGVGAGDGNVAHDEYMATSNQKVMDSAWEDIKPARTKLIVGHVFTTAAAAALGFGIYHLVTRPELPGGIGAPKHSSTSVGITTYADGATVFLKGCF